MLPEPGSRYNPNIYIYTSLRFLATASLFLPITTVTMGVKLEMLGLAFGLSLLLSRYAPQYSIGLLTGGVVLYLVQFAVYSAWTILFYPRYFSPLRHVPEAPDGNLFIGQTRTIIAKSSGQPMREWIENTPNDGLIRYSYVDQNAVLSPPAP